MSDTGFRNLSAPARPAIKSGGENVSTTCFRDQYLRLTSMVQRAEWLVKGASLVPPFKSEVLVLVVCF